MRVVGGVRCDCGRNIDIDHVVDLRLVGWRLVRSDGKVKLSHRIERPKAWGGRGDALYVRAGAS